MDSLSLHLVLVASIAWAMIFLGYLPSRLLREKLFTRQILRAGLAWLAIALISPAGIFHFYLLIGILCLVAWWRLEEDHGLSGKAWFNVASALGISLGLVLLLALDPRAFPSGPLLEAQVFLLASLYLGSAVIGLAYVTWVLTRPAALPLQPSARLVERYASLLLILALIRSAFLARSFFIMGLPLSGKGLAFLGCSLLPILAWRARRQVHSPRPTTSGWTLLTLCLAGILIEIVVRSFGL